MKHAILAAGLWVLSFAAAAADPDLDIVDATGKVVGPLVSEGQVAISLKDNQIVVFALNRSSFVDDSQGFRVVYYYMTSDCSGTRYMNANGLPVRGYVYVDKGILVYPSLARATIAVGSVKFFVSGGPPGTQTGFRCQGAEPGLEVLAAPTITSPIAYTSPFDVRAR